MVNVLVNNEDLTVVGSLDAVEVQIDVGAKGDRGTNIFVGQGVPNESGNLSGVTVIAGDLYINTTNSYMYKKSNDLAGTWEKLFRVGDIAYSASYSIGFTDGVGTLSIPVADIFGDEEYDNSITASQILVQYRINGHDKPLALSMTKAVTGTEVKSLDMTIKALQFNFTSPFAASLLTTTTPLTIDVLITLVEGA